jgi:phosphatidylglycerophosphatase A
MENTTDEFYKDKKNCVKKIIEIGKKLFSGVIPGEYEEIRQIELVKMLMDCPIDMQYTVLCLIRLIDELKPYLIKHPLFKRGEA